HYSKRDSADHSISKREVLRHRRRSERELGDQSSLLDYPLSEFAILFWINRIKPGAHHTNGETASFERSAMRGRIDPAPQPGHYGDSALGQIARQLLGNISSVG